MDEGGHTFNGLDGVVAGHEQLGQVQLVGRLVQVRLRCAAKVGTLGIDHGNDAVQLLAAPFERARLAAVKARTGVRHNLWAGNTDERFGQSESET